MPHITSADIFCKVIDNFGDAGVCYRLARAMAVDRGWRVRLFIDLPDVLAQIVPAPHEGVDIIKWDDRLVYPAAADLVIEAFACDLPHAVLTVMANRSVAPVWVDLEYLTAEDWALSCHALPSPHPATGLKKTLFFPGFDVASGGIIRENDLIPRRNSFQMDISAQNSWRMRHSLPQIDDNFTDLSLFSYKTAPNQTLFNCLTEVSCPVRVFLPVEAGFGVERYGASELHRIPFLSQHDYDYLLWTCALNFVRGEDSFVRAQLAGRPLIWNIYVQDEDQHLVKLDAFLKLYGAAFSPFARERLDKFHEVWNQGGHAGTASVKVPISELLAELPDLQDGACRWSDAIGGQTSLLDRLDRFCQAL